MRPWISAASFQDDFAGLPELLHLSHAPGLSQPGNSQIADLVFGREKCAEAGQKTKLSFPAPVKPLFPNCLVTDRRFRISFEPSRLKYRLNMPQTGCQRFEPAFRDRPHDLDF
jgi:hypothetical protein